MQPKFTIILSGMILSSVLYGQTLSPKMSIHNTEHYQMPRADINDITPFENTVKLNNNNIILELFTPPIGNQGIQGSCAAWAFGYGCASIQAYNAYQDWEWARRSSFAKENNDK